MNPQGILEQFLGPNAGGRATEAVQGARNRLADSGMTGVAGGLAAGGVLGLLIGNKKVRKKVGKVAGGVAGYGGAAVLGALAHRAYQNWQAGASVGNARPGSPGRAGAARQRSACTAA